MKKFFLSNLVIVAVVVAVALSSCNDKDTEPKEFVIPDKSVMNQTVFADEAPAKVSFETKGAWTSSITANTTKSTANWISISPNKGDKAGEYTITITLVPNDTQKDRWAEIILTCNGEDIIVKVTQKATDKDGNMYVIVAKLSPPEWIHGEWEALPPVAPVAVVYIFTSNEIYMNGTALSTNWMGVKETINTDEVYEFTLGEDITSVPTQRVNMKKGDGTFILYNNGMRFNKK